MSIGDGIFYSTVAVILALAVRAWFRAMSKWW